MAAIAAGDRVRRKRDHAWLGTVEEKHPGGFVSVRWDETPDRLSDVAIERLEVVPAKV